MGPLGGLVGGKDNDGGQAASPTKPLDRRQTHARMGGKMKGDVLRAATIRRTAKASEIHEDDEKSVSTLGSKDPVAPRRASQAPIRRASLEGGTAEAAERRRGSYTSPHLHNKLRGSIRMAQRRLSFAFGNAMTIKVESRSTNLCRCPASNPWTQLISAHDGTTVDVMKKHVIGALGKKGHKAPLELQILHYKGTELHNDKTLRHYHIKDGAKLILTFKPCQPDKEELRLGYLQHRFPALCYGGDAAPKLDVDDGLGKHSPRLDCSSLWTLHTAPKTADGLGQRLRWKCVGAADGKGLAHPPPSRKKRWPSLLMQPSESSFETVCTPQLGESNVMGSLVVKPRPMPRPPQSRASVRGSFTRKSVRNSMSAARNSMRANTAPERPKQKGADVMVLDS